MLVNVQLDGVSVIQYLIGPTCSFCISHQIFKSTNNNCSTGDKDKIKGNVLCSEISV